MNSIALSGRIVVGPTFHTNEGGQVAVFTLCCGGLKDVVAVVATRNAALELEEFKNGDSISVAGRIIWHAGAVEILADRIIKWTPGVYQKHQQQDKFPQRL